MRLRRLLCFLGLHEYECKSMWEPNIDAPIITKYHFAAKCTICGKLKWLTDYYDLKTGRFLRGEQGGG